MALHHILLLICIVTVVNSKVLNKSENDKATLEEFIKNKKNEINHRYKPHYHVTPPVGWMNDPNGFSFYKDEYHLFYQFYPYDSAWGPMHWGHVSSPDLVSWTQLPTALIPEDEMCFSGSAVVDGDDMVLMYTGRRDTDTEPFFNETQYLAFSNDGINFEKYEGNPILSYTPNDAPDFRDPKLWKHGDYWYVIIGSKTGDYGRVLLYRSQDLINWDFLNVIGESTGKLGYMWECPDFFEINGKFVLLMSPQGMEPEGDRYKNIHQTGYIIGSFNYETFEFVPEVDFQEIDFGHDFYASQTMEKDGKRYLIAWFSSWEVPIYPEAEDGWAGVLTIARELELVGNTILMKPVKDIVKLREYTILEGELKPEQEVNFEKTGEIIIEFDLSEKVEFLLEGTSGGGKAWIRWDPEIKKVVVDRGSDDVRQVEWVPIGSQSWRIFLDSSSLELFCGEGEVVFSSRVYAEGNWKLTNLSPQTVAIEAYHLRRSMLE